MDEARNRLFDEIALGDHAEAAHLMTSADVEALVFASGAVQSGELAKAGPSRGPRAATATLVAPGAAAIALVSTLVLRRLPGPGSEIVATAITSGGAIEPGDTLTARIAIVARDTATQVLTVDCRCSNQRDELLLQGSLTVLAPRKRLAYDAIAAREFTPRHADRFAALFVRSDALPAVRCAVVHPCDRDSLEGALEAAQRNLIVPVLVGPEAKIRAAADAAGASLEGIEIMATEHSHAAAAAAAALARDGKVDALMKGSLHTDELMEAIVAREANLRTARRMSHVFVLDVPAYPRLLLITDAAINIAPDLDCKADIARNAIDLAHALGIDAPRIAILAAVEMVNARMPSTLDAAALCKMADRGQITGGVLDGPLAFDNAVSPHAAAAKGIVSPVAGCADILLAPDLDAGNMIAKQLQYLAGAASAGIVMGARVPVVLTSRADSVRSRLASSAVMKLCAHALRIR